MRVQNVMLVPPENQAYRATCRHGSLVNRSLRAGEGNTAMQRLPRVLESAARAWLSRQVSLIPQRILSYEQIHRGRWVRHFREIDAVAGDRGVATALFEIKVGHGKYAKAYRQLQTSAEVLDAAAKGGQALVVVFVRYDDEEGYAYEALPSNVAVLTSRVAPFDAVHAAGQRPLVMLSARAMWNQAVADGVVSDLSLWDEARAEYHASRVLAPASSEGAGTGLP